VLQSRHVLAAMPPLLSYVRMRTRKPVFVGIPFMSIRSIIRLISAYAYRLLAVLALLTTGCQPVVASGYSQDAAALQTVTAVAA